jgi:hypothetical protein
MARDDDDEPRPKRRPRDDDDDDEPRPKKRRDDDAPRTVKRPRDEDEAPRTMKRPRDQDEADDYDDAPPRRKKSGKKGEGLSKVIPYKNKLALTAYYVGVFSLIPGACFILGPIAFFLGLFGLIKARNNPKAHGTGHAIAGILLGLLSSPLWVFLWYAVFEKITKPQG